MTVDDANCLRALDSDAAPSFARRRATRPLTLAETIVRRLLARLLLALNVSAFGEYKLQQ